MIDAENTKFDYDHHNNNNRVRNQQQQQPPPPPKKSVGKHHDHRVDSLTKNLQIANVEKGTQGEGKIPLNISLKKNLEINSRSRESSLKREQDK